MKEHMPIVAKMYFYYYNTREKNNQRGDINTLVRNKQNKRWRYEI